VIGRLALVVLIVLIGCSSPPVAKWPAPAPESARSEPPQCPTPGAMPLQLASTPQQLVDQLTDADREIAYIDDELLAAGRTAPDAAPTEVARIEAELKQATEKRTLLERELGAKHPDLKRAIATEKALADDLVKQRDLDTAFEKTWRSFVERDGKPSTPAKMRAALVTAMRATVRVNAVTYNPYLPSGAPGDAANAAARFRALRRELADMASELGEKNPERRAAEMRLEEARDAYERAGVAAAQRLAASDPAALFDREVVAHRADVARAAELARHELAALDVLQPAAATSVAGCPPPPPLTPRVAEILAALAPIDRELDTIDRDIERTERDDGPTRLVAQALATDRIAAAWSTSFTLMPEAVVRLEAARVRMRIEVDEKARELGRKNPEMQAAQQDLAAVEALVYRQREVEIELAHAYAAAIDGLPKTAMSSDVWRARLAVLRTIIARIAATVADRQVASDTPWEVQLPARDIITRRQLVLVLERDLGPRHPDLIRAKQQLDAAEAAFQRGARETIARLEREEHGTGVPLLVDAKVSAHRRELAARAGELRRELLTLLQP
jgi:hypothetical protein